MLAEKSSKFVKRTIGLLLLILLLGVNPVQANSIYVDAGGPYEADVGEEIEFDASASSISDGSPIQVYYWDWNGDGQREGFSGPTATHTWHTAFEGEVRLYIFYPGGLGVAKTHVKVTGPDTELVVTLSSNADLHLFGPNNEHAGINYDTGFYEMGIAGASLQFVPDGPAGINPSETKLKMIPQIAVPLFSGGTYDVEIFNDNDGNDDFTLTVQGFVDGALVSEKVIEGSVVADESVIVEVDASYEDGELTLDVGEPSYSPELEADPDDIEVAVLAGGTHTEELTLKETGGVHWATGVSLLSSDLTNDVYTIPGAEIRFSENNFDIAPDGERTILVSIPVPDGFVGAVTGTLTVRADGDVSLEIPVAVRKAGAHAPVVEDGGPYLGVVGTPLTFDTTGSYDPDGEIEEYCWDWGLDGAPECTEDPTIEHTWDAPYVGVVQLSVVDNDGRTTTKYVAVTIVGAE